MLCHTSLFIFSLCRDVTFYKTFASLSTVFIKAHVGLVQLLKWPCRTSFFTHVEPYTFYLPHGVEIELIFALQARGSNIWPIFKIAIFGHEIWPLAKFRTCTYIVSLPQGVEIELIFTLWAAISEIRADFQNCHIYLGMKL